MKLVVERSLASSTFPRGLVGEVAQFIFDAAPMPVKKIALTGAIGLLAGITGRAYNVSGTGLNQYLLLIAQTGFGKEAIAGGISKLMKAVHATTPCVSDFVGPTEIASPQALTKWLTRQPCVFSIVGEFGLKLKEMSALHAPAYIAGLKRSLLDLYHKSGSGSVLGAMAYSKKEDNTPVVSSPSFTLIGESTPEKFFENINEDVVTDGLLPRFSVIEYTGELQKLNKGHGDAIPSPALVQRVAELAAHCSSLGSTGKVQTVSLNSEAEAIFDRFEDYLITQMTGERVIGRELWNRAHLKAMKLAALHAVGCNYINPCIDEYQAWHACNEIFEQTKALKSRFEKGDVGAIEGNAAKQQKSIERVIAEYTTTPYERHEKYLATEAMHRDRVIPASYIQKRLLASAAFRGLGGGSRALNEILKRMVENDELREIPKQQMVERFNTTARAFAISNGKSILEALD